MAGNQTNIGLNVSGDLHARDISVVQNVRNVIKPADPPAKNIRFKVEKPIQTFTGREAFLEDLHKVVKEGHDGGVGGVTVLTQEPLSVVAATGGIGKTETVRMYIQHHGHEYDHIIWIDAEDASFARSQFYQLAMRLKISTDFEGKPKEFELILTELFEKLLLNAHVVLLVFDSAEALEDDEELKLSGIRSLRPTSLSPFFVEPTIIVTSRNRNWGIHNVISLGVWTAEEVVVFVTGRLKLERNSENETLALQVGTLFGRLPIALQSAVAVILQQIKRKKKYGIQSLIDEYKSGCRKVLAQKPLDANMRPTHMSDTMMVLWNISLEKIVRFEDGELAIKILCFMAYMSPTRIPQDFLFALFQSSTTNYSFENALEILEDYLLIASLSCDDSDSRNLSIHRMIQDSTIENLRTRTKKRQTLHNIFKETTFLDETEVLLQLSKESVNYLDTFTIFTLPHRGELVESLVHITNHVSEKLDVEEFRGLTWRTANVLRSTNNFPKSIELFERAIEATPSSNTSESGEKIALQGALAFAYREGGHEQKSLDLYLKVLEGQNFALGPHHEHALDTKTSAAVALENLGRYNEALQMYREVLQGYENNGDTRSSEYLEAKSNFAVLLLNIEENEEPFELFTEVLKEQEKDPESNSNNIIVTKLNIAVNMIHKGQLEEASKMLLQNVEDVTKRLGSFNLLTLHCRRLYASGLYDQRKYDLAAPVLRELLEIGETQLGSHHPFTLKTKVNLGAVYLATKELDKAEALLDVEVLEKVFGPEHLQTLKAATFLSSLMEEQGKFGDALALREKVLQIRKRVLVPHHEDTLHTMYNIGVLYFKADKCEKAVQVAQELLERQKEAIGKDHPDAIKTLEFITFCMEHLVDRQNLTMNFMAFTSVDAETGKICLKASNWNFKAALNTYSNSNPNQSRTLTLAQIHNNLIRIFMAMTGVDADTGKFFVQAADWKLMGALEAFCESRFDENMADMDLQDDTLISSAAATDAEDQNAVSCN